MKVLCVANQKGGVAKTTTATSLYACLVEKGYKTLFIDMDPQCNSTDTFRAMTKDTPTIFDVILDLQDPLPVQDAVQHTEIGDIVAGDPAMEQAETILLSDKEPYFHLSKALQTLKGYDFVIIDTGPAKSVLSKNVLTASDIIIVPITADRYGIQGLSELNISVQQLKKLNPKLRVGGLLLVKYNYRATLTQEVEATLPEIAKLMDTKIYSAKIRNCTALQKAQKARMTILGYDPKSNAAADYRALADEIDKDLAEESRKNK